MIKAVTESLNGITDAASANAALSRLYIDDDVLDNLKGMWVNQVPDAAKPSIKTALGAGISNVEQLVGKVTAIPGVGNIVAPDAKKVLDKVKSF